MVEDVSDAEAVFVDPVPLLLLLAVTSPLSSTSNAKVSEPESVEPSGAPKILPNHFPASFTSTNQTFPPSTFVFATLRTRDVTVASPDSIVEEPPVLKLESLSPVFVSNVKLFPIFALFV